MNLSKLSEAAVPMGNFYLLNIEEVIFGRLIRGRQREQTRMAATRLFTERATCIGRGAIDHILLDQTSMSLQPTAGSKLIGCHHLRHRRNFAPVFRFCTVMWLALFGTLAAASAFDPSPVLEPAFAYVQPTTFNTRLDSEHWFGEFFKDLARVTAARAGLIGDAQQGCENDTRVDLYRSKLPTDCLQSRSRKKPAIF